MEENVSLVKEDEVAIVPASAEVSVVTTDVEDLIPVEERGMEATEENEYAVAAEQGFFSAGIGTGCIKVENGPELYAVKNIDKKHQIAFEFRQRFSNGIFTPAISICKADLELAVGSNFNAENIPITKLKVRLNTFLADIVTEFWNKGMDYAIPNIYRILKTIYFVQDQLPVYSEYDEQSEREDFYKSVIAAIEGREPFRPLMLSYSARAYYPLTSDEMDFVARQFNLSATALAKKLDRFGFLYRAPSSNGYQTKVRVCSDEVAEKAEVSPYNNCYCVLKLDYIINQAINSKKP